MVDSFFFCLFNFLYSNLNNPAWKLSSWTSKKVLIRLNSYTRKKKHWILEFHYRLKIFIKCHGIFWNTMDAIYAFKFKPKRLKISYIFCEVVWCLMLDYKTSDPFFHCIANLYVVWGNKKWLKVSKLHLIQITSK